MSSPRRNCRRLPLPPALIGRNAQRSGASACRSTAGQRNLRRRRQNRDPTLNSTSGQPTRRPYPNGDSPGPGQDQSGSYLLRSGRDHSALRGSPLRPSRFGGLHRPPVDDLHHRRCKPALPLHDFRRQLPANERADFERLSQVAKRYGVSLTAAILRWLEYTETRAIMIVSNEGFAFWSRSSDAAFKSGRFVRTKQITFELPAAAVAARREFTDETKLGVQQPLGVWHFPEPVLEMCIRSERYDQEITLVQFEGKSAIFHEEEPIHDTFDQFMSNDRIG